MTTTPKFSLGILGKLSVAILENYLGKTIGEDAISLLKAEYKENAAIIDALAATEQRFRAQCEDRELSRIIFDNLPIKNLPSLKDAVSKYYSHPTNPELQMILVTSLQRDLPNLGKDRIETAINLYLELFTEELAIFDEDFRAKAGIIANLRSQKDMHSMYARNIQGSSSPPFQAIPVTNVFIGRDEELKKIKQTLLTDNYVIVIRNGIGGIGKTTLAATLAHSLSNKFADGVLWAQLATTDTMSILASFISSLEQNSSGKLKYLTTIEARAGYFRSLVSNRKCLIVLDNAETATQVLPLLSGGSQSRVLITTRYSLSPDVPINFELNLQVLSDNYAVELLSELLNTKFDIEGLKIAKLICSVLGNLPLAIRIAAGNIRELDWDIAKFLLRLQQPNALDWLSDDESSKGVRSSFAISFESLPNDDIKKTFYALGVFTDLKFSKKIIGYILRIDDIATEKRLLVLIKRGLIEIDKLTQDEYRIHPLLRLFAEEILLKSNKSKEFHEMAGNYCQSQIARWDSETQSFTSYDGLVSSSDVQFGLDAVSHYMSSKNYSSAQNLLMLIANTLKIQGRELLLLTKIEELHQVIGLSEEINLYYFSGVAEGKIKSETNNGFSGLHDLVECNNPKIASAALLLLSKLKVTEARSKENVERNEYFREAEKYLWRSLKIKENILPQDYRGMAYIYNELARISPQLSGTPAQSLNLHNKALELQKHCFDLLGISYTLRKIATIYLHHFNDIDQSLSLLSESEKLILQVGDRLGYTRLLLEKARILQVQKRRKEALEILIDARKMSVDNGVLSDEAYILKSLSTVHEEMGNLKSAYSYACQSLTMFSLVDIKIAKRLNKKVHRLSDEMTRLEDDLKQIESQIVIFESELKSINILDEVKNLKKNLRSLRNKREQIRQRLV